MAENVLVYLEQRNGVLSPGSLRLLTAARRITDATGGAVHALLVGHEVAALAGSAAASSVRPTVATIPPA